MSSVNSLLKLAILTQKVNPSSGKKEWVLVSRKDRKPLKYFGPKKPSEESVLKEERRIQYFKAKGSKIQSLLKQAEILTNNAIVDLLIKLSSVGIEDGSHPQGRLDYNLTGNDYWAGSPHVGDQTSRLHLLHKRLKQKLKKIPTK